MQPEKELRADHQAIRRTLRVLDGLTAALREGHAIRDTDLRRLVSLTRELATDHHEDRERPVLEVLREDSGGPDPNVLHQLHERHGETVEMLDEVHDLVDQAAGGDQRARNEIAQRTARFVEEMEELMSREEEVFLNDLDSTLTREQLDALADRFGELDEDPRDRILPYVDRWADRYEAYLGS